VLFLFYIIYHKLPYYPNPVNKKNKKNKKKFTAAHLDLQGNKSNNCSVFKSWICAAGKKNPQQVLTSTGVLI